MRAKLLCLAVLAAVCAGGEAPLGADVVGEGVTAVRCTEAADIKLPRTIVLEQTVRSDLFSMLGKVGLGIYSFYDETVATRGKLVATAFQVKPDATETKLAKIIAKFKQGEADKLKIVDAVIEDGDRVRYEVKLKGLPDLEVEAEDCWNLGLTLYVADEIPD